MLISCSNLSNKEQFHKLFIYAFLVRITDFLKLLIQILSAAVTSFMYKTVASTMRIFIQHLASGVLSSIFLTRKPKINGNYAAT